MILRRKERQVIAPYHPVIGAAKRSHHHSFQYHSVHGTNRRTVPPVVAILMYEYMATGRHKGYIYRANRLPF